MRAVCSAWRSSLWVAQRLTGPRRGRVDTVRARAHGSGRGGPASACSFCGALLLELVGARTAALLPCESPRSPDACAACADAKREQRENPRARALGRAGPVDRCRRDRCALVPTSLTRRGVLAAVGPCFYA